METSKLDILSLGLTTPAADESRRAHGANQMTPPKRKSLWRLYLEAFRDPIIRILLVAACLSLVVAVVEGDYAETIGIFCAIFLATGIGFYFEYDANKKFDVLNALGEEAPVTAVRDGKVTQIARHDVVVGDIVLLEQGDEIPADGELLEAVAMQANESSLTGEPVARKSADRTQNDTEATYPTYMLYRGCTVMDGHGVMHVTAVGDRTEIGRVAHVATVQTDEDTPLNRQLNRLAGLINKVGFGVAIATFLIFTVHDLWLYLPTVGHLGWREGLHIFRILLQYFMMAVTLIVMAVPEGLPMAVTLSLALNMRRMLKTNNLVRKLHACETMGAITTICTDKTGTLTQNQMQVQAINCAETNRALLAELIATDTTAYLADDRRSGIGNPTEVALLLWLQEQGTDYLDLREACPVIDQLPFSTERKYMVTLVQSATCGRRVLYVKGASEMLSKHCAQMDEAHWMRIQRTLLGYQQKAMRTLGFAYKYVEDDAPADCLALMAEGGLTWLGEVAISDPVRPDVPGAVGRCLSAGINIKVVTGDTSATATEIARQIGLWTKEDEPTAQITGAEFANLTDEEAAERARHLKVMSRARPMDKQRLVQLLQQQGEVVAVTGDGTNDAPALNFAQVGLSMGSGTSVAKEASDITLLDDSFNSIVTAVLWGRSLYKNIQRFILFQLTINVTALLIVLIGSFVGTELPLTVTQMLWINLIMDTFAALALASLPADPKVMRERPRAIGAFILTRQMLRQIGFVGISFVIFLLGMIYYLARGNGEITVRELTIFFTVFVMLQFWNLLNAKVFGTNDSAFKNLSHCKALLLVLLLIGGGQFVIVELGGRVFRTVPLEPLAWFYIVAGTSVVLWIGEAIRALRRIRQRI